VVAPVGAADTAWVAWGYTNGASSGSLTLTLTSYITPGTYNARLFPNDTWQRLAVSNTISVLSPTVAASPSSLTPGGTLTVSWQNIGAPTTQDWLTLNPVGAADANWLAWIYGTGRANDSALFPIPSNLPAGSYEVRLFSNGTFNRLAVSNTVTVTAPGPGLAASPALVAPNGTMTVSWQNIASPTPNDWIGVFPVGSSDTSYSARISTGGRASDRALIQLPGGLAAGSWELRLYSNNTFTRLASSNTFTVGQPGISVNKASVEPGGTVTVTWSGLPSPTPKDWYALIPQNGLDSNWYVWSYTTGTASGSGSLTIPATVPMGTYELRLYANDGFQRLAVSNLVTVQPTVTVSPTPVAAGGTVTITWAGISAPTPKDWFTLNPLNNNDHAWLAYVYGDGRSSDSLTFTLPSSLPAGLYDMRLYSNDSWTRLSLSNIITVTAPGPTLSAGPVGVASGTSVTVSWSGIPAPSVNNWIGLYAVGAPNANFLKQVFTNGQAAGSTSFTAPSLPAGAYELRLFADSSFTRLAVSNGITALAGAAVQASPTTVAKGSTITIAWQGIANPAALDFVTLNQQGAADQTYIATAVTGGVASGTLTLTMPAGAASGNYDIRLFSNNTWTRLGASNVIVVP
jgi:5-hydroxyisourate hydrolase-like protein (transthyretin family)